MTWFQRHLQLREKIFQLDLKNKTDGLCAGERANYKKLKLVQHRLWAMAADEDFKEALAHPPILGMTENWTMRNLRKFRQHCLDTLPPVSPLIQ